MKLLRYGPKGQEKPGLLDQNGKIRDLSKVVDDIAGETLSDATPRQDRARSIPRSLPEVTGEPRIGPCVAQRGQDCVYRTELRRSRRRIEPAGADRTGAFRQVDKRDLRSERRRRDSAQLEEDRLGSRTRRGDRQAAKYVSEADALDYVAGYCVVNDVSEREWQIEHGTQWDKGKGFDTFGPIGPWLVTKDEIADPQQLDMWLEVDGHRYQNGSTKTMVFGVAAAGGVSVEGDEPATRRRHFRPARRRAWAWA